VARFEARYGPQSAAHAQKILWFSALQETRIIFICSLGWMGNIRPVDNSVSRDSERLLAVGAVTRSDRLVVELVEQRDTPAILIKWPARPTVTDPAELTATVAAIVRVLGTAQIELAARRAAGL
jgi:hypothetical protein